MSEVDNGIDEEEGGFRKMPQNLEIEQALLGAMFVNKFALEKVCDFLEPDHFYEPVHGRIYETCLKLFNENKNFDPVILKPYFENDPALEEIGGAGYLVRLAASATTIIHAEDYGRMIYDLSIRRDLINVGEEMVLNAFDSPIDDPASEQIERAEGALFELSDSSATQGGFEDFSKSVNIALRDTERAWRDPHNVSGKTTGIMAIDEMLGGLHDSDLIIIAGRPAMGKTALATNIAFNCAAKYVSDKNEGADMKNSKGAVIGFFSLEMAKDQLAARILSERAQVNSEDMRRGKLTEEEFSRLARAAKEIQETPLFIDDTPALSISALRTRARRLKRQKNLGVVVIDYLQLMRGTGRGTAGENRVQEISEITRGLKGLAKELNIPVIALSQLSRKVEERPNKRPMLSDLRESGSIEQDADIVLFVYRKEYYLEKEKPENGNDEQKWLAEMEQAKGKAEIIAGKNRHGAAGIATLSFQKEFTKFGDIAQQELLPERFE